MEKNKSNMENKDIFHNQSLKLVFSLILAFNLAIALAMAENITAKAGDLAVDGDVNATNFYGDGSGLSGILTSTALNEINIGLAQNITNTRTSIDNNITKVRAEISSNSTNIRSSINLNRTNLLTNISTLNTTLGKKVDRGETGYTLAWASGNNILYNSSINTKVGIGTTNPLVKLHIQGNGSLLNITNASNTFLFVNSSGKVGIGTSRPSTQLDISDETGIAAIRGLTISEHFSTAVGGIIKFDKGRGTKNAPTAVNDADKIGGIFARGYNGSEYFHGANIGFIVNGDLTQGYVPTDIVFSTKATDNGADSVAVGERMRITSTGNVGIGTTSPAQALTVVGQINVTSLAAASATDLCINGGVLSSCSSSKAFKENIQNITINAALWENYLKLNPVIYNFKGDSKERIGLIAEDVQPLLPKVVYDIKVPIYGEVNETSIIMDGEGNYIEVNSTKQAIIDEKAYPSVDYDDVAAANVLFIQDLKAEVETIKAETCRKDNTYSWC